MTPERLAEIKAMLAKKFPTPAEMIDARQAAKELVVALERALEKAEIYKQDWHEAKSEFGTTVARLRAELREVRNDTR